MVAVGVRPALEVERQRLISRGTPNPVITQYSPRLAPTCLPGSAGPAEPQPVRPLPNVESIRGAGQGAGGDTGASPSVCGGTTLGATGTERNRQDGKESLPPCARGKPPGPWESGVLTALKRPAFRPKTRFLCSGRGVGGALSHVHTHLITSRAPNRQPQAKALRANPTAHLLRSGGCSA